METGNSSESFGKIASQKDRQLVNVLFVCNEWNSSKGGLSTFNREFAINLAKTSSDTIKVHCYVTKSNEQEREDARKNGVDIITAESIPGTSNPMEWLRLPPPELKQPDMVIGHGRKFGTPAYCIMRTTNCEWIQFVHVFCEDLGKHKVPESPGLDTIEENEKKHKEEIKLCKAADVVVAVGSRLQEKYNNCLPDIEVQVITPGILESFRYLSDQRRGKAKSSLDEFSIFVFGRASYEDLVLKGYDIIASAVGSLGEKFKVTFVGAPEGEHRNMEEWFLKRTGLKRKQLTIRGFCDQDDLKRMLYEADLVAMPSRTEGFGLVALEAISAGVPVLVTVESGIAKALQKVEGEKSVVESEEPKEWAKKIKRLSKKKPEERLGNAICLRENYNKTYSWSTQCERFTEMIGVQRKESCHGASGAVQHNSGTPHSSKRTVSEAFERSLPSKECSVPAMGQKPPTVNSKDSNHASAQPGISSVDKSEQSVGNDGETLLHAAARSGDVDTLLAILSLGLDIDSRNSDGATPLMIAAAKGRLNAFNFLLERGSDWTLKDNNGQTVLHWAAPGENDKIFDKLLSLGVDINSSDSDGITPLMSAAAHGRLNVFNILLERGADPYLKDNDGLTVLHSAAYGDNFEIIEKLLSLGLDIDLKDNIGETPLMVATSEGNAEAVKYLLSKGAR